MSGRTHFVGVKLTDVELQALDQAVAFNHYRSRSEFIVESLRNAFERLRLKPEVYSRFSLERTAHPHRKRLTRRPP